MAAYVAWMYSGELYRYTATLSCCATSRSSRNWARPSAPRSNSSHGTVRAPWTIAGASGCTSATVSQTSA